MNQCWVLISFFLLSLHARGFQRELSPDRPDVTESPITVEPKTVQIETSVWSYTKDGSSQTWSLLETNIKTGITKNSDLQLVIRPWIHEKSNDEVSRGFGDLELRYKHNLWGNDGGKTAGGVMPYVSIPSHSAVSSEEWEGGIIFPFSYEFSDRYSLAYGVEFSRSWHDDHHTYEWNVLHSTSLGISLNQNLGWFIEYVGIAGESPYQANANTGFTWSLSDHFQWDISLSIGLNRAAEDFSIAQGFTYRF